MAGDHFFLGKAGDHLCCTSMKLVLVCQTIKASSQKKKNDQCLCIELALVSVSSPKREPIHVMSLRASPAVAPPPPRTHTNRPLGASRRYTRRWGRFCAQSSPPARPQAPKLAHFAAQFWRINGPYGRE